jgi:hypothetical protein
MYNKGYVLLIYSKKYLFTVIICQTGGMVQVVEYLLSKCKAPSPSKKYIIFLSVLYTANTINFPFKRALLLLCIYSSV